MHCSDISLCLHYACFSCYSAFYFLDSKWQASFHPRHIQACVIVSCCPFLASEKNIIPVKPKLKTQSLLPFRGWGKQLFKSFLMGHSYEILKYSHGYAKEDTLVVVHTGTQATSDNRKQFFTCHCVPLTDRSVLFMSSFGFCVLIFLYLSLKPQPQDQRSVPEVRELLNSNPVLTVFTIITKLRLRHSRWTGMGEDVYMKDIINFLVWKLTSLSAKRTSWRRALTFL